MISPVQSLQSAVDIVNSSPHPDNKIAATIFHEGEGWSLSRTNYWPHIIEEKIGRDTDIGNSSGTIHAETACVFAAAFEKGYTTTGASIAITDPPCPNCVKNMAEAGIDNIYIDHKGFHKDFARRRIEYFNILSVRLAEKAGISMYEVNRKTGAIIPITIADKDYIPFNETPIRLIENRDDFISLMSVAGEKQEKHAMAFCKKPDGARVQLISISHPALGFRSDKDGYEITHPETKYSIIQEACNRLIMNAARHSLSILEDKVYCSEVPTSRELVNMVGAGIRVLVIYDIHKARDEDAVAALELLGAKKIIDVET